ncbi:aldehyde dehydrogenase family-domain-containing protein [Boletus edulis]|nr:aldehyde dehydrogenase family-domain-containing protein [Boletus edulis]
MPSVFTREFDIPAYKGQVSFDTVSSSMANSLTVLTRYEPKRRLEKSSPPFSWPPPKDVDTAVDVAQKAFDTIWAFRREGSLGDPLDPQTAQGPQVSEIQFNHIMGYIKSGKEAGAKVEAGGERQGTEGYFIQPTIFTNTSPDMKIVQEEIFGPVCVVIKFKDEDDVVRQANDTFYGLAAAVFTQNLSRAIKTAAHRLKAGTAWVNYINQLNSNVPFGGFKQSGIGRELGEYALLKCLRGNLLYTAVKAVHINLDIKL